VSLDWDIDENLFHKKINKNKLKIKINIMMKKRTYTKLALQIVSFLLLPVVAATAQDAVTPTPAATVFAGSADIYYKYDFAQRDDNGLTSFTRVHDSFELGMASVEATHKMGKASVFVDLGFGRRAFEFSGTGDSAAYGTFLVKQLNMTYEFSDKFKITAGAFGTHLGYELVDAVDNKNYSMSYAFTNGPFFNTGIKAQYTAGKLSFMLGLSNPTDFKSALEAKSKQKTVIGQVGYVADSGSIYLNFTSGSANPDPINKSQIDIVATKKLNSKFTLGFNGTYALLDSDLDNVDDQNWFSVIGYAQYAFNDKVSLAYRLEYFDDKDGIKIVANLKDNNVLANTLSFNIKEGNFTFIPEVRFDSAAKDTFFKTNGDPTKTAGSILLATTYSF
jgi:Putative beta-barrel porin-2, OmpL-like. bbp2